jgi:serine/threonine protein kinase
MIGKTLGHYQITNELGRGGMGEVFQAKDQVLGRDVAIKVLPEEFAKDADRVARFQREAKVLASLNHPNIAAIYGLEESGGTNFLVLELVEGKTLADRIKSGPIPVEEALKLALQIAEALEAAHEKGVIHRDLKPANIKVTSDGKAKVLDFGLAKAFAEEQSGLNLSNSPTLSNAATQQGIILGTAAYMSPEQAKGKAVDKRADIWAFGVVLFEMLTGRQQFTGESTSEILASVLKSEPEWNRLPQNLHPRIRLLLERCLEKEPRNRYSGMSDARVDLQKALADPSGLMAQPGTTVGPRGKLSIILPWAAATLVLGSMVAGVAGWYLRKPEPHQVILFEYDLAEGQQFSAFNMPGSPLAVSPNGKQFAYSTRKGLYLRSMDELTAKLISGTEESTQQPFFSPDGKWIGYFSDGERKLKKISVTGGTPVVICEIQQLLGASWCEDNTIVYGQYGGDIMQVPANGGTPKSIVKRKSAASVLVNPQILPGAKGVLYQTTPGLNIAKSKVIVQSLKSVETKELFAGMEPRYLPTGYIAYSLLNGSLFVVPFDADRLEIKSEPVSVLEGVIHPAISESGTVVYIPTGPGAPPGESAIGGTLVWVNRQGKEEPLSAAPAIYRSFRISPDGKRIALAIGLNDNASIWILDLDRASRTRLTFDEEGTNSLNPIWMPDGKRIIYNSSRQGFASGDIYWMASDGTGEAEKLASSPGLVAESLSKDGKTLVTRAGTYSSPHSDIGTLSMEGGHASKPLLQEKYEESNARISPDGKWIAYQSNESGRFEIYVRPFPDVNQHKWPVSTSGGDTPLWSPDGRELFYRNDDATIAVPVEIQPTFKPGKPTLLFRGEYQANRSQTFALTYWDISPDGKRFLMLKENMSDIRAAAHKITVVVNGLEELKQKVPVK